MQPEKSSWLVNHPSSIPSQNLPQPRPTRLQPLMRHLIQRPAHGTVDLMKLPAGLVDVAQAGDMLALAQFVADVVEGSAAMRGVVLGIELAEHDAAAFVQRDGHGF